MTSHQNTLPPSPRPIEWLGDAVRYLDQTVLPLREEYRTTSDYRAIIEAVKRLEIRGAPLIGVAAAYAATLAAKSLAKTSSTVPNEGVHQPMKVSLTAALDEIASARPTAVNLQWAIDRMKQVLARCAGAADIGAAFEREAIAIHQDDAERCRRIGEYGAGLIHRPAAVLTHCNAGALATGGIGTAVGVIACGYQQGHVTMVYVDETRPLLQGARLTAWEMQKAGIPATLIADNMAAFLMQQGKIDLVVTGADRIAANGDTANKIGTYGLAVLAKYHRIPFYIAAPTSTIDPSIADGAGIPIEIRGDEEITEGFGRRTAPAGIPVYSPAFDITPGSLITAIITENGVVYPPFNFKG